MATALASDADADVQLTVGTGFLHGVSAREVGGVNPAQFVLRDGTDANAPALAYIRIPAGSTEYVDLPDVWFQNGIFLDLGAVNTVDVVAYVS